MRADSRVSSEFDGGLAFDTEQPITMRHFLGTQDKSVSSRVDDNSSQDEGIEMTSMTDMAVKNTVLKTKGPNNSLSLIDQAPGTKCCRFLSGIYLKYFLCQCFTLYRSLIFMWLVDPLIIAITLISIIPILQIDGTKIDIQIVVAVLKVLSLCIGLKFN